MVLTPSRHGHPPAQAGHAFGVAVCVNDGDYGVGAQLDRDAVVEDDAVADCVLELREELGHAAARLPPALVGEVDARDQPEGHR